MSRCICLSIRALLMGNTAIIALVIHEAVFWICLGKIIPWVADGSIMELSVAAMDSCGRAVSFPTFYIVGEGAPVVPGT